MTTSNYGIDAVVSGNISTDGSISGGSISTGGSISGGSISTSGSISGGSISTSGSISGGNISTGGSISGCGKTFNFSTATELIITSSDLSLITIFTTITSTNINTLRLPRHMTSIWNGKIIIVLTGAKSVNITYYATELATAATSLITLIPNSSLTLTTDGTKIILLSKYS